MDEHDDGKLWGWMLGETFIPLPKEPMLLAGLGPPPFSVKLPNGDIRHVVHRPIDDTADHGNVRIGAFAPTLADTADAGKVRIGAFRGAF